jgi:SAM-dependent methyltransferase
VSRRPRTSCADRSPASFDHADPHLLEVLADLEGAVEYARWIQDLIRPHVHGDILEVGAGQGTYSPALAEWGTLVALEPSEAQSALLRRKLDGHPSATVVTAGLEELTDTNSYDAIVLLNVLEHIPDDRAALATLASLLRPGGRLVLWVPAFELIYGRFDHRIGHYRRYRRRDLLEKCTAAGLRTIDARYTNLPGFFAWALVVRVLRLHPTAGHLAHFYDRAIIPVVRRIEERVRPPFGQSLLLVAERVE